MLKIGIINGPNLNMLGKRDKKIYGNLTLEEMNCKIKFFAEKEGIELVIMQSNFEGEIIEFIQQNSSKLNGLIINPAAYTHYSYAIADALRDCPIPVVEVHLSNIFFREDFRGKSVTASACIGQIAGFGYQSYILAIRALQDLLKEKPKKIK
ncbi:type II 3-dehydroquinate dehydratase [bacterium]|nr:type II 3-dehydroquinate dehydratase [bacterium]MBU4509795.1 type II 3-dehydroquinate dehydratase [bacterium]